MNKYMHILLICLLFSRGAAAKHVGEELLIDQMRAYVPMTDAAADMLYALAAKEDGPKSACLQSIEPLSFWYLGIKKLPYLNLGSLPTPVHKLEQFGMAIGLSNLYIKRDDLSGALLADGSRTYGGNKLRKLELFFGDALDKGAKTVVTFGPVGSNHATATALHAQRLGFRTISMLTQQIPSYGVRDNLKRMYASGSQIHYCVNAGLRAAGVPYVFARNKLDYGDFPYFVPTGGSSPLGTVGYVNAVFELKKQIEAGAMPEPDLIYVACGSVGTAAGLMLGVQAAGLKTRIVPVCIEPEDWPNYKKKIATLITDCCSLLRSYDQEFPEINIADDEIDLVQDFTGRRYAMYTSEGMRALELLQQTEGIRLDGTYTAKAMAALIAHAKQGILQDKVLLFWNTYCDQSSIDRVPDVDYHRLPIGLHRFFEEPVQALDVH